MEQAEGMHRRMVGLNPRTGLGQRERSALQRTGGTASPAGLRRHSTASGPASGIWGVPALSDMRAMAVEFPVVHGHPNRLPFEGVLTLLDVPSDKAPSGARGHRVVLTRQ